MAINKFRKSISIRKELYDAVKEFYPTIKEESLSGYLTRIILEDLARHDVTVDLGNPKPKVKKETDASTIVEPDNVVSDPLKLEKKAPKIEKIEQILENLPTEKPVTVDIPIREAAVKPKKPDVVIPIVSEPLETPVPDHVDPKVEEPIKAKPPKVEEPIKAKPPKVEEPIKPPKVEELIKPPKVEEPIKAKPPKDTTVIDNPMTRFSNLIGGTFRKPLSLPPAKIFGHPLIDTTNPASYHRPNGATVGIPCPPPAGKIFFERHEPLKVDTPKVMVTQDLDPKYDLRHLNIDVVRDGEVILEDTVRESPKPPEIIETVNRNSTFTSGVEQTTINRVDSNQTTVKPRSWQDDLASNQVGEFAKQPVKRTVVKPEDLQVIVNQSTQEVVGAEYTAGQPNSNLDSFAPGALEKAAQEFVGKPVHTSLQHIEPPKKKKKKKKKVEPEKVELPKSENRAHTTTPKHLTPSKLLAPPVEKLAFRDRSNGGMSFSSGFDMFDEKDDERFKKGPSFSILPPEQLDNVGDITKDANGNSFFDGPAPLPSLPKQENIMDSIPGPPHVPMPSRGDVPMTLWHCQIGTQTTFIAAQNIEQVQKYVANSLKLPSREAIKPSLYEGPYNKEFLVPGVLVPDEVRAVFGEKELPLG